MKISEVILNNTSWGCNKTELEIPVLGKEIKEEMKANKQTNANSDVILNIAFNITSRRIGFTFCNEFEEMIKLHATTMLNNETAKSFLKQYWEAVRDELRSNPKVFMLVKEAIIYVNSTLGSSNSRPKMIRDFKTFVLDNGLGL